MLDILLFAIPAAFVSVMFIMMFIDKFSKSTWFCIKMGWHKRPIRIGFDGASHNGKCPRCGKRVLQDSQGNWF